jgi:uncharacterized protein (TIGR02444 family)
MSNGRDAKGWHGTDLWDFSLAIYGEDGVKDVCLAAQDRLDADVNVLLWCCWLGATGRGAIAGDDLARVSEAVSIWQAEIVKPLRAARRRLGKPPPGVPADVSRALREAIAANELEAEHIEQAILAETVDRAAVIHDGARREGDIRHNLAAYLSFLGAPRSGFTDELCDVLSAASDTDLAR